MSSTGPKPDVLRFRAADFSRRGRLVLQGLDFSLPKGCLAVILGTNGAGKSTLLAGIAGLIVPEQGEVEILGALTSQKRAGAQRRRCAWMPQLAEQARSLPLSVRELVGLGHSGTCPGAGALPDREASVVNFWIQRFGLAALATRPMNALSGGELRRAHLARVLAQEAELILLDEPTGHLDLPAQEDLLDVIGEVWAESGRSIVMATHELRSIPASVTHVLLLREGRLLAMGSPEQVLVPEQLGRMLGRPCEVLRQGGRYHALLKGARP